MPDVTRIVGTRAALRPEATLTRAAFELYNGLPLSVREVEPVKPVADVSLIGDADIASVTIATLELVAARFTRAPVVATRDVVAARDDVAVRATVPAPVDTLRVDDVARPAPPVARVAAAFVAATFDVVRVAAVDVVREVVVPRDATPRAFDVERGEVFDVVRAATAREEFADDARPVAPAVPVVGTVRPIVVRFVFVRVPVVLRDIGTEDFVTFSFTVVVKSASS